MPNCIDAKDLIDDVEYWRKATDYWSKEYFKLDFKYQKCYKICFELANLIDRIEQARFFNQREWRELWQDKLKEVQDRDIDSADKFYDSLLKIIDDAPTADVEPVKGWISVKDRLPENDYLYIVCRTVREHQIVFEARWKENKWLSVVNNNQLDYITHWMPLPKPPGCGLK